MEGWQVYYDSMKIQIIVQYETSGRKDKEKTMKNTIECVWVCVCSKLKCRSAEAVLDAIFPFLMPLLLH